MRRRFLNKDNLKQELCQHGFPFYSGGATCDCKPLSSEELKEWHDVYEGSGTRDTKPATDQKL